MKENFDEKLRHRIKSVFDNYQDDGQASGWELLKSRIEEKKRKKVFFIPQSLKVAAVLIPVLLFSGWLVITLNFSADVSEHAGIVTNKEKVPTTQSPGDNTVQNADVLTQEGSGNREDKKSSGAGKASLDAFAGISEKESNASSFDYPKERQQQEDKAANTLEETSPDKTLRIYVQITPETEQEHFPDTISQESYSIARLDEEVSHSRRSRQSLEKLSAKALQLPELDRQAFADRNLNQMKQVFEAYFTLDNAVFMDLNNSQIPAKDPSRKLQYALGLSSMYNYTEVDSKSSLNYGGSITAAIPLMKHLSISSGVQVSRQNFSLEEPRLFTPEVTFNGSVQQFEGTDINLVALDIPINLNYTIPLSNRRDLSVSAGVSSLVYLREDFTNTFSVEMTETVVNTTGVDTITTIDFFEDLDRQNAFGRFDFARMLNLSVGFSYPVSKALKLQVAPYLKYPIGKLTERNLKFGMGGIRMRLQFGR